MLVQNILIFIKDLKGIRDLTPCDIHIYNNFVIKFTHRAPHEKLNSSDIQFLMDIFRERWEEIVDSKNDYMLNIQVFNQYWIQLAKDLASFTNKGYLQILLPGITNTVDFNNLSQLTETVRFENFYLGYGNKVLYRKRGLCEHLIDKQFVLSTCRDLGTSKLSPLSVDELARLQSCKQRNGKFSIGEEAFADFWDFVQKKVFPRLQSKGEMRMDLLAHLLGLIEQYYALKTTSANFKFFKQSAQRFFKLIYQNKLDNINCFYGIEIPFKGKNYYLLDFLIVINRSQTYVLDEHLNAIIEWLYQFHPALKIIYRELEPVYAKLEKVSHRDIVRTMAVKESSIDQCLTLILSLFTTEFEYLPLSGNTISLWDMTHTVFSEASGIFLLFEPLLASNKIDDLIPQYEKIIKEFIKPGGSDLSLYTWITRFKSVKDWYKHVENNSLSKIGVNWFQPELLIHVLLRLTPCDPLISSQINTFLDELIHTYAQDKNELLKQLRVNILFSNFIKRLSSQDRKHLMILTQLYHIDDVKNNFLSNCIYHIANSLSHLTTITDGGSIQFFTGIRRVNISKLIISLREYEHVNKIVDAFKTRVYSPDLHLDTKLLEKLMVYLRTLSRPILTIKEQQEAQSSARTLDYLGAPT